MVFVGLQWAHADDSLLAMEKLAKADPGPFVIVESRIEKVKNRAQGVVITPEGHVLSVGHIAWIDEKKSFTDSFRISFRGSGKGLPEKAAHRHKATYLDREGEAFYESFYPVKLLRQGKSRFVDRGDLAVFKIPGKEGYPMIEFFSKTKPELSSGETLHLCHFIHPHTAGDPFLLMSPLEVVGVARTSHGLQYLAKGYYRIGSSGGAILKDGRLIGIQSSAYTINGKKGGEAPYGMISFELVWKDRIAEALKQSDQPEEKK